MHAYDTCPNKDFLYSKTDAQLTQCPKCQEPRPTKGKSVRIINIADKVAELLVCDEFREGMQNYAAIVKNQQQSTQDEKVYKDVFDGQIYQQLLKENTIDSDRFNIMLKLDIDGFTCSSSKTSMVMVNAVILSIDPSER